MCEWVGCVDRAHAARMLCDGRRDLSWDLVCVVKRLRCDGAAGVGCEVVVVCAMDGEACVYVARNVHRPRCEL